jgi:hypothetical protein
MSTQSPHVATALVQISAILESGGICPTTREKIEELLDQLPHKARAVQVNQLRQALAAFWTSQGIALECLIGELPKVCLIRQHPSVRAEAVGLITDGESEWLDTVVDPSRYPAVRLLETVR